MDRHEDMLTQAIAWWAGLVEVRARLTQVGMPDALIDEAMTDALERHGYPRRAAEVVTRLAASLYCEITTGEALVGEGERERLIAEALDAARAAGITLPAVLRLRVAMNN